MRSAIAVLLTSLMIGGCAVVEFVYNLQDRPIPPGAFETLLNGRYVTFDVPLLDRVRFIHKWLYSGCDYRVLEPAPFSNGIRTGYFPARSVVELDGKTWQIASDRPAFDFSRWVRSIPVVSKRPGREGQIVEEGLRPVCFDFWQVSSQYLRARFYRMSLDEFEAFYKTRYPINVEWARQIRNGFEWRVKKVPPELMVPRSPSGVGGPYQVWITAIADTGYAIAFEMGASRESLGFPREQEKLQAVFDEILDSFEVIPIDR